MFAAGGDRSTKCLQKAMESIQEDRCCEAYEGWIEESAKKVRPFRDGKWAECVAVGSRAFVTETKERLGIRAIGRKMVGTGECCELPMSSFTNRH